MRGIRAMLIAVIVLGVAGAAGSTGPRTLTRAGDLYSARTQDNQVVITTRHADGTVSELFVPQSAAAVEASLQVGVDEATGAVYVLWQKFTGMESRLRLAGYIDGTWIGPRTIAGDDGIAAFNPVMLVHRSVSEEIARDGEDSEPVITEIATSFLHVAWWSRYNEDDPGCAVYTAIELQSNGIPMFGDMKPVELYDLMPYGVGCFTFEAGDNLRHPKFFIEPRSGNLHIFTTDLGSCHFHILELVTEIENDGEGSGKRRRQIIILNRAAAIALRPDMPLASGTLKVGGGLTILIHWDDEDADAVNYLELDESGVSEIKSLILNETLNHEQAVDLIRNLTN